MARKYFENSNSVFLGIEDMDKLNLFDVTGKWYSYKEMLNDLCFNINIRDLS